MEKYYYPQEGGHLTLREEVKDFTPVKSIHLNPLTRCSSILNFRAPKTVSGARPCKWKIVHVKKQTSTLLIITN